MKLYWMLILVLLLAFLPDHARAQRPPGPPQPPPLPMPSSLLFVRFMGPPGVHVTLYQENNPPRAYPLPVTVGLRPGYFYRVELSGLPSRPGMSLAPSLEVRGTLHLPPRVRAVDYPAPVWISDLDINHAVAGAMITKVVYLEHPERAPAVATSIDQPQEIPISDHQDMLAEARVIGRPVLIMRMGGRQLSATELARQSLAGTILLPGQKALPLPRIGPCLPWEGICLYDPVLGPKPPEEECLHDGGDSGRRSGIDREGRLQGLDPSDTIAEFTDSRGQRHAAPSNRVCLCVPRFGMLRCETPVAGLDAIVAAGDKQFTQTQNQFTMRMPSYQAQRAQALAATHGRQRASAAVNNQTPGQLLRLEVLDGRHVELGAGNLLGTAAIARLSTEERVHLTGQMHLARQFYARSGLRGVEQAQGTIVVGRVSGLGVVSATAEMHDLTVYCKEVPQVLQAPGRPLRLFKWADREAAQVGDIVTFYLKFSNQSGQPITDLAVSDSLTTRLEYIPGTAQSDRNAVFTVQPNEAGSTILRWEISGRLLPGEGGVVRFQARIR